MQYVDCDRVEKHGNLCLGYGYEENDEPCEQCKNCIKCEGGYYQLGETEKDDQLTKAKEHIENLLYYVQQCTCERSNYAEMDEDIKQAKQFLKDNNNG